MKRIFLSLIATCCFASHAPALAADEKLDPMAVAVAHDLLAAMRYKHTLAAELKVVADTAPSALRKLVGQRIAADPKLDAAGRQKLIAQIDKKLPAADEELDKLFGDPAIAEEIIDETARIYTRLFTVDDMQKMATFYRTPVGAKMLGLMPRANAEAQAYGQRYIAPRTEKLLEDLLKTPVK